MAGVPWTLTDSQAKNIYNRLCSYYGSPDNLPNNYKDTGVFFGYANFTRDKLYYCIEYLKKNFSRGWFNEDFDERSTILHELASQLYSIFWNQVDVAGIYKFLSWVYNFTRNDVTALNYFQGGQYSSLQNMIDTATQKIVEPASEAIETIKYGVSYPTMKLSNPLVKWGLIIGGGYVIFKLINKR